jgi:uncharacterized GH25 family protein
MKSLCTAVLVLAVTAGSAQAHFVFLVPSLPDAAPNTAAMIFSDNLKPDPNPMLLKKIAQAELFARSADGKIFALKHTEGKDVINVAVPEKGFFMVAGVCRYGVVKRGESEPFLLNYYPKTFVGLPILDVERFSEANDKLPLEIIAGKEKNEPTVRVLWQGKPLAGAEVVLLTPDGKDGAEGKTDKNGLFVLGGKFETPGLYGIRARHEEKKEGELDGKKYTSVRHYATLTIPGPIKGVKAAEEQPRKADPEATKLLADARAARANWENFPGFRADLEINLDGKVFHAPMKVSADGDVSFKLDNAEAQAWAHRSLASLVGHRIDNNSPTNSACAFADADAEHPLGRAIQVLDDEFHSSYRIRDRQVIVVNRTSKDSRFTITVLENRLNEDKQFLPVSYVVNYWDATTAALKRSESHHQSWTRVGKFDLPTELMVVLATPGKQEARRIKISNHKLLEVKPR